MVEQSLMMIRSLMVLGDMGRAFSSMKTLRQKTTPFSFFTVFSDHIIFQKSIKAF
jgi:hypothetical protein